MQFLNGTRLGSFLQTLLYITGVPIQQQQHHQQQYHQHLNSNNNGASSQIFSTSTIVRGFYEKDTHVQAAHAQELQTPPDLNKTRCYGVLGCITMKYGKQRGFELFPEEMHVIRPRICLQVSQEKQCQFVELEETAIRRLLIGLGKKSYWIAHGYVENGHRSWIQEMADELLAYDENSNVFVIDWATGAEPPYTQAVTNIELIGAYIGFLMTILEDIHNLKISDTHFIGHSLGAHLGGFVGSWLVSRGYELGRITGLDPAQPYFELFPPDIRLDSSDAAFVDVIHTDAI